MEYFHLKSLYSHEMWRIFSEKQPSLLYSISFNPLCFLLSFFSCFSCFSIVGVMWFQKKEKLVVFHINNMKIVCCKEVRVNFLVLFILFSLYFLSFLYQLFQSIFLFIVYFLTQYSFFFIFLLHFCTIHFVFWNCILHSWKILIFPYQLLTVFPTSVRVFPKLLLLHGCTITNWRE